MLVDYIEGLWPRQPDAAPVRRRETAAPRRKPVPPPAAAEQAPEPVVVVQADETAEHVVVVQADETAEQSAAAAAQETAEYVVVLDAEETREVIIDVEVDETAELPAQKPPAKRTRKAAGQGTRLSPSNGVAVTEAPLDEPAPAKAPTVDDTAAEAAAADDTAGDMLIEFAANPETPLTDGGASAPKTDVAIELPATPVQCPGCRTTALPSERLADGARALQQMPGDFLADRFATGQQRNQAEHGCAHGCRDDCGQGKQGQTAESEASGRRR